MVSLDTGISSWHLGESFAFSFFQILIFVSLKGDLGKCLSLFNTLSACYFVVPLEILSLFAVVCYALIDFQYICTFNLKFSFRPYDDSMLMIRYKFLLFPFLSRMCGVNWDALVEFIKNKYHFRCLCLQASGTFTRDAVYLCCVHGVPVVKLWGIDLVSLTGGPNGNSYSPTNNSLWWLLL